MAQRSEEVERLVEAHMRGDLDATCSLARAYGYGEGVKQDEYEAVRLFKVAAEGGHAEAQVELGNCYREGVVVEKDEQKALLLYRQASDAGEPFGHVNLGAMHADGHGGLKKNAAEAERLYLLADGDWAAHYNLGLLYEDGGEGVPQNLPEALRHYSLALSTGLEHKKYLPEYERTMRNSQTAATRVRAALREETHDADHDETHDAEQTEPEPEVDPQQLEAPSEECQAAPSEATRDGC